MKGRRVTLGLAGTVALVLAVAGGANAVPVRSLVTALGNDYYHFDPVHHRLSGERTRQVFRLGDALRVQVTRVDLDERKIDLVPV